MREGQATELLRQLPAAPADVGITTAQRAEMRQLGPHPTLPVAGLVSDKVYRPGLNLAAASTHRYQHRLVTSLPSSSGISNLGVRLEGYIRGQPGLDTEEDVRAYLTRKLPITVNVSIKPRTWKTNVQKYPYWRITITQPKTGGDPMELAKAVAALQNPEEPAPWVWCQDAHQAAMHQTRGAPYVTALETSVNNGLYAEHLLSAQATVLDYRGSDKLPLHAKAAHVLRSVSGLLMEQINAPNPTDAARDAAWRNLVLLETESITTWSGGTKLALTMHNQAAAAVLETAGTLELDSEVGKLVLDTNTTRKSVGLKHSLAMLVPKATLRAPELVAADLAVLATAAAQRYAASIADIKAGYAAANKPFPDGLYECKLAVYAGLEPVDLATLTPAQAWAAIYTARGTTSLADLLPAARQALLAGEGSVLILLNAAGPHTLTLLLMALDKGGVWSPVGGYKLVGATSHHTPQGRANWFGLKGQQDSPTLLPLVVAIRKEKPLQAIREALQLLTKDQQVTELMKALRVLLRKPAPLQLAAAPCSPAKETAAMFAAALAKLAADDDMSGDDSDDPLEAALAARAAPAGNQAAAPAPDAPPREAGLCGRRRPRPERSDAQPHAAAEHGLPGTATREERNQLRTERLQQSQRAGRQLGFDAGASPPSKLQRSADQGRGPPTSSLGMGRLRLNDADEGYSSSSDGSKGRAPPR